MTKQERVEIANKVLCTIAAHGRKFFLHEGRVSRFELDQRGRIWFIDAYTLRRVYVAYEGRWRGFTEGGTLRDLVKNLRDFIRCEAQINQRRFGPWPEYLCDGDLWGYGDSMAEVRQQLSAVIPGWEQVTS